MLVPRRHGSLESYKYGFNGKEKDDEIKGEGAQYDYGFRIYDPRIGKFLSKDPLFKSYPWLTPYQFSQNDPIRNIDIDGLEGGSAIEYWANGVGQQMEAWWNSWSILPSSSSSKPSNTQTTITPGLPSNAPNKPAPAINTDKNKPILKKVDNVQIKTDTDKVFTEKVLPMIHNNEGGYQNSKNDSGNWVDGKLIGTNLGISAPVLNGNLGRTPKVDEITKLTPVVANEIYKDRYWDKPRISEIKNEAISIQFADMYVNAEGNAVKIMKRALNNLGNDLKVNYKIDDNFIDTINNADQEKLHSEFKKERKAFYQKLNDSNPEKYGEFIDGWLNRADKFEYKENKQ